MRLCVILVLLLTGCDNVTQAVIKSEADADAITSRIDQEMYLNLWQRQRVYEIIRTHLQSTYATECTLK